MKNIKNVWLKCFNDSEEYFDSFLARFYLPDYIVVHKISNKIVSVSYILPCTSILGNTAYLFGLATLPEYRGKGYASALVRKTLDVCKKKNFDVVMQIPAKKSMKNYFLRFGFIDADIHLSFATDFILGMGNSNEDISMIMFLKNQNTSYYPSELVCKPCYEI